MEAILLRDNHWAVRPTGQLGTCGFHPRPWTVIYVTARSAEEALHKAAPHEESVMEYNYRFCVQRVEGKRLLRRWFNVWAASFRAALLRAEQLHPGWDVAVAWPVWLYERRTGCE